MTTATVGKRDGFAEAITAVVRARAAAQQIAEAHREFIAAMTAVADGMAVTAAGATRPVESWEAVQETPFGELSFLPALAVGERAHYMREDGCDGDVDWQLADLERLLRGAVDEAGPTDDYRAKLDSLWQGGDDV